MLALLVKFRFLSTIAVNYGRSASPHQTVFILLMWKYTDNLCQNQYCLAALRDSGGETSPELSC